MTKNYPSYKSIKSIFFPPVQLTQRNYQKIAKFLFALLVTDLQHSIGSVKKVMEMLCLTKTQNIEGNNKVSGQLENFFRLNPSGTFRNIPW